jgi:uncharacterized protein YecE (DUF72 family)
MTEDEVRIGTAGWSIPGVHAALFPGGGSHLERYARVLSAVEIDSTFYRSHRTATYARWSASVPDGFRFSVKVPREITHRRRLLDTEPALSAFLQDVHSLGAKLGPILVQLPPSLAFEERSARAFFDTLRGRHDGEVACEPRHAGWFAPEAEALLTELRIARVAADPARVAAARRPAGWPGLVYYRLHGSPRTYYSAYPQAAIHALGASLLSMARRARVWCIFDNTAAGAAAADAVALRGVHLTPASGTGSTGRRERP